MSPMTQKERKAIAEVFRKIRPDAKLTFVEIQPVVKYLLHFKDFSKTENDVLRFFAHCFKWFCDKQEKFAELPDATVIYLVADRFEVYMKDRKKPMPYPPSKDETEEPSKAPIRMSKMFLPDQLSELSREDDEGHQTSEDEIVTTGEQGKPSMSYTDLIQTPKTEWESELTELRTGLFSRTVRWLRGKRNKESEFYLNLIEEYVKDALKSTRTEKGRKDWELDNKMMLDEFARLRRIPGLSGLHRAMIKTLTRIKSYPKARKRDKPR